MSFDHDAAEEREVERTKLTNDLYSEIAACAGEANDTANMFFAEFHIGLLVTLMNGPTKPTLFENLPYRSGVREMLAKVQLKARSFARHEAEYRKILHVLDQMVYKSATLGVATDFCLWEMHTFQERASA